MMRTTVARFAIAILCLTTVCAAALARAQSAEKTLTVTGRVTVVSQTSMTILAGEKSLTFSVDKATQTIAKGAGSRAKAGPVTLPQLVHVNDQVFVRYVEGSTRASVVRVTSQART